MKDTDRLRLLIARASLTGKKARCLVACGRYSVVVSLRVGGGVFVPEAMTEITEDQMKRIRAVYNNHIVTPEQALQVLDIMDE